MNARLWITRGSDDGNLYLFCVVELNGQVGWVERMEIDEDAVDALLQ